MSKHPMDAGKRPTLTIFRCMVCRFECFKTYGMSGHPNKPSLSGAPACLAYKLTIGYVSALYIMLDRHCRQIFGICSKPSCRTNTLEKSRIIILAFGASCRNTTTPSLVCVICNRQLDNYKLFWIPQTPTIKSLPELHRS